MISPLFLTADELRDLTGYAIKAKQISQLRTMGIAFRVNGCGKPVVTRSAIEGNPMLNQKEPAQAWRPAVLQGGRQGG